VGTQTVTVNGAGNYTLGTVVADTLTTTGVTGTVSATLGNSTAGAVFNGGAGATTIVGTVLADNISTGAGGDNVTGEAGADAINVGAGTDTVVFAGGSLALIAAGSASTALADSVTGMTLGTGNDVIRISLTLGQAGLIIVNGSDIAVSDGPSTVQVIPASTATTITGNVIVMTTPYASSTALLTAIGTTAGTLLSSTAPVTASNDFVIVWSDGTNGHIGLIDDLNAVGDLALLTADLTYSEVATLVGLTTVSNAVSANFNFIT
jgi:hypothetical protein